MRPIERLAAIEARAQSATSGQWSAGGGGTHRRAFAVYRGDASDPDPIADDEIAIIASGADAAFIAHAREDVPFLVAALREAWAELDAARAVLKSVEWRGPTIDTDPTERCPECDAMRFAEHRRDCVLAACLRGAK